MSWEYFWHSNYTALNTPDSLSASIYIFKQCMFNICTFSFFSPSPTTPKKKKLICGKATDVPFHRECAGKDVWNAAPQILQSLSPVRPGPSSSSGSICTSKSRIIVCITVIHIGPKSWLWYLLGRTVVLILQTESALWLPVENKTFA